jgi:glycosyltransferase involved in cell wall biosynthesis
VIHVLHVITKLEMGGAQENTLDTCARLDRGRFRVTLVHGPGGWYDDLARRTPHLEVEVVESLVREVDPMRDAKCFADLRSRMRALRPDIVHTHSSKAGVLGRFAARAAGVPVVIHSIHGFGFFEGQNPAAKAAFIAAEIAASKVTDAFISVSRASLAEAIARGIVTPAHEARVIRSGFDLAPFFAADARRSEARRKFGLADEDEVLVSIANFKPQKDPLTLVEAARILFARRPRALLLYAGDGELRPEMEAAIAAAGVGSRLRLLGWREDVPDLLAAADVVVLASLFEGLPRSAVQALAAGRPFVGTRVDGTAEIIRSGRNGFLVEPRDPPALAEAIERALVERPVDMHDRALVREWDVDRMVREQEALYESLAVRARQGFTRRQ